MTRRAISCFVLAPAAIALATVLTSASTVQGGDDPQQAVRPTVLAGDDLIRIFQEGKDAAETLAPPENSLGTAFDPLPPQPVPPDYR
jgi:hypothetical protein